MKRKPTREKQQSRRRKSQVRWRVRRIAHAKANIFLTRVLICTVLMFSGLLLMTWNQRVSAGAATVSDPAPSLSTVHDGSAQASLMSANRSSTGKGFLASIPLVAAKAPRRRLRVVIYARYSTEEQDASSITDQISYCKDYLKTIGIEDPVITVFTDEGVSGELRNRPGIDHIWKGIAKPEFDLLLCEDCSRLFRNSSACVELAETAYDNGMRIVCINDNVDSDREGWDDLLREAAGDHARANHYLRRRILRKILGLWRMGAAVTGPKAGYQKRATVPASMGERAKGPFHHEVVEEWRPIVKEVFERVANGDPLWLVANWLTEIRFPKNSRSKVKEWNEVEVGRLIRQTVYRGLERHRVRVTEKKKRTGTRRLKRNPEPCWERPMPHLRIVSDALWYQANAAIDARKSKHKKDDRYGADHPLFGSSRDSRGPLSDEVFICGCCEQKMHMTGRKEGGYRCSRAVKNRCWSKATALRDLVHERIGQAIGERLLALSSTVDALVEHIQDSIANNQHRDQSMARLRNEVRTLEQKQGRLLRLATSTDDPPKTLVQELSTVENELACTMAELTDLSTSPVETKPEITRDRIRTALEVHTQRLITMNREAGVSLKSLIPGKIRAVPYLEFGTNKVVLRAEFELHMVNLVPSDLKAALNGSEIASGEWAEPISMCIDLFKPPKYVAFAMQALELYEGTSENPLTCAQIGKLLGLVPGRVHLALRYGRAMRAAGITDPYIRLTECPANVARWRTHAKFLGSEANGPGGHDPPTNGGGEEQAA